MRWESESTSAFAAALAALSLVGRPARADGSPDPTSGRIDGDLAVVAGGGVVFTQGAPRVEGELRVRYLESAGVYVAYEDAANSGPQSKRVFGAGLEFRPVFLGRWLRGRENDPARVDLFVDSIGLEAGIAVAAWSDSAIGWSRAFQVGLGAEVPVLDRATGPWVGIHAGMRWSDAAAALGISEEGYDRAAYVSLTVAWHEVVAGHLVDLGDGPAQ